MLRDVVEVRHLGRYRLWLRFDDDTSGEVDLESRLRFTGVFEPLREPAYFARVTVDKEGGTITWPNGADLDPVVLYSWLTGQDVQRILFGNRREPHQYKSQV